MKKILTFLAVSALLLSSQAFAAGSGSGGSTKPASLDTSTSVETETEVKADTAAGESDTKVEAEVGAEASGAGDVPAGAPATDAVPPDQVITPSGKTAAEVMAEEAAKPTVSAGAADAEVEVETQLCNDLDVLKDRIECRLKKDADEIEAELKEVYMPEECRAMADGDKQSACVERYKSLKPCWRQPVGPKRISCVKEKLEIDKLVPIDNYCEEGDSACRKSYRWKVYNLITFRFYDAEERAEEWYAKGYLTLEDTRDFIAFIVQSKLAFYEKSSKEAKVKVIKDVMSEWDDLVVKVKASMQAEVQN